MIKTLLFVCSMLLFAAVSFAQTTVTTVVDSTDFPFTDDLIFDSQGNFFCADYSGAGVYKRTPNGTLTEFASGFNTPNGLAFDSFGNLFICDNIGNAIYKLDDTGAFLDTFAVNYPSGIIKDANSDTMIFTTYGAQSHLKKLAPNGTVVDFHSGSPLNGPVGLAYCQGELYVANFSNRAIYHVLPDSLNFIAQLPGSGSLGFIAPLGNYLFATAFSGNRIYKVHLADSSVSLYAGSSSGSVDGPIQTAKFTTPNGIVINSTEDTMYVSEYSSKKLRMITGFTAGTYEFMEEMGVTIYPNPLKDLLFINDVTAPFSIQVINSKGKVVLEERNIPDTNMGFNVSHLPSGNYLISVKSPNFETVERIIKIE